jgi:RNA polymerase sigma-70 factor (ECF subfamily)
LQRALQQLPDRQRQVFTLRYFEELSYRDIAQILDLSEGALKASFHHAAKKIERYIEENGLD